MGPAATSAPCLPSESSAPDARLVRYPTFDSAEGEPRLISAFVYPGVGEGPRPGLIEIHGGPEGQARLRTAQGPLQKYGITTITPNVRGSTGYGRTFTKLDDQYLREDVVRMRWWLRHLRPNWRSPLPNGCWRVRTSSAAYWGPSMHQTPPRSTSGPSLSLSCCPPRPATTTRPVDIPKGVGP